MGTSKSDDKYENATGGEKNVFDTPINNQTPTQFFLGLGYTFGRMLGEGSYCKVRVATRNTNTYAVKIISTEKQSQDFVDRFLPREISILRIVKHPNIIRVFEIVEFKNHVYIVMEALERGDMLEYIRDNTRLSESEAHRYFVQLIAAIQYLHSINICHRDLKCENVMLGSNNVVKLIDFGFCKKCVDDRGRRALSETYCGSTAYASPEVLMGHPYNPMMYDVWSLGCVLFIMVTGSMPFDDSNVQDMLRCQMKKKIRFPGVSSLISHDVKKLIRHMLEPDVTKRSTVDQIFRSTWFKSNPATSNRPST